MPRSTDDLLVRIDRSHGGRGYPLAWVVWISEVAILILQCMRKPGVIAQLIIDEFQRACAS